MVMQYKVYYTAKGRDTKTGDLITLDSDHDYVAAQFRPGSKQSERAEFVAKARVRYADRVEVCFLEAPAVNGAARADVLAEPYALFKVPPSQDSREIRNRILQERLSPGSGKLVERISPVLRVWGGRALVTRRLLAGLRDPEDSGAWLLEAHRERRIRRAQHSPAKSGDIDIDLAPSEDPQQALVALSADERLSYVEPSIVNLLRHPREMCALDRRMLADDPRACYLEDPQHAFELIKAKEALGLQPGDDDVVIAILDEGIDTRHDDLQHVHSEFDAITGDQYQEPDPWEGHGTACAGLAVAKAKNERGMSGVGAGCQLMPVRMARTRGPGAPWMINNETSAAAVYWACNNGASILSLSWSGGAPSTRLALALEHAATHGRKGRGCVIVVAAGNEERRVNFPGNLPCVLTVGASNANDEPKTKLSRDQEHRWGSNYGPELDLVAPGVRLRTTDILGQGGYHIGDGASGNYSDDFSGTSASTPLVAGAAGLVLSANPRLSRTEVYDVLCDTADRVGPFRYVAIGDDTSGGRRNDHMGHGRLNVESAVREAQRRGGSEGGSQEPSDP